MTITREDLKVRDAAPELLAALKALVARHEWVPGLGPCICPEHVAARAAIAKAEGR